MANRIQSANGEHIMNEKSSQDKKPDTDKIKVLRSLPTEVLEKLTKNEVKAILFDDTWPDSLREKLKNFLE